MVTLREVCVGNFYRGDLSTVDFVGMPPHLMHEVMSMVKSPATLSAINDRPENQGVPFFDEAVEDCWHELVLSKFWAGNTEPLELPSGESWRTFYELSDRRRNELLQSGSTSAPKPEKSKKSKVMDMAEVKRAQKTTHPAPHHHGSGGHHTSSASRPEKENLGSAFMKKWRSKH
jgi:hypothetical protein